MQHDARTRGERRTARSRAAAARRDATRLEPREPPGTERVGLAVARVGLRLAGRDATPLAAPAPASRAGSATPRRWSTRGPPAAPARPSPR